MRMQRLKKCFFLPVLLPALLILILFYPKKDVYKGSVVVMDSALSMTVYVRQSPILNGKDKELLSRLSDEAVRLSDALLDPRNSGSQCYAFNNSQDKGSGVNVNSEFMELMKESADLAKETDGAVDPTIGHLISLWNIEENYGKDDFVPPDDEQIDSIKEDIGYENIRLEGDCIYAENDIMLDFGALGKGYALDKMYDILSSDASVTGAVISMGSSILVMGDKEGEPFEIGLRDPEKGISDIMGTFRFGSEEPIFISTSGSYERYAEDSSGTRFSHIMDTRTLRPVDTDLLSVTAICDSGLISDGLSTALFVKGESGSEELLKKYNAEAVFVYNDGRVHVTDGLRGVLTVTSPDYRYE